MTTPNLKSSSTLTGSQKRFLKERGLFTAFQRAKRIKKATRAEITQDDRKQVILLERRTFAGDDKLIRKKTIIRDFFSLRVLGTSKKNINQTLSDLKVKDKKAYNFSGKRFTSNFYKKRLIENRRIPLNNVILVERTRNLGRKFGQIYLNITFYKNETRKNVEAGSHSPSDLSDKNNRNIAFDEAFKGCLSQIDFSYDRYEVNWIHYAYFIPKQKVQPVFQEREIEVAI